MIEWAYERWWQLTCDRGWQIGGSRQRHNESTRITRIQYVYGWWPPSFASLMLFEFSTGRWCTCLTLRKCKHVRSACSFYPNMLDIVLKTPRKFLQYTNTTTAYSPGAALETVPALLCKDILRRWTTNTEYWIGECLSKRLSDKNHSESLTDFHTPLPPAPII